MKKAEKINKIKTEMPLKWLTERQKVFDKLSDSQPMFCICGKLATGLHEIYCKKFNNLVDTETLKNINN